MRDVIVPVTTAVYERYAAGTKCVEVRNAASPVAAQVRRAEPGATVRVRRGHNPANGEIIGALGRVSLMHGWSQAPAWATRGADLQSLEAPTRYFDPSGPLVAFEVLIGQVAA